MEKLRESVVRMDAETASTFTRRALDIGLSPGRILDDGLGKGMEEIGEAFNDGKVFLPQIIGAAHAMQAGLDIIAPILEKSAGTYKGTVIMGSVQGDIHEIGKSVCCVLLRGAGYRVVDLGADVSPHAFADAAREYDAEIIGASALMTTTLIAQKDLLRILKEDRLDIRTTVGGAPCSQEWCDEIGADGYTASAGELPSKVAELMRKSYRNRRCRPRFLL